MLRRTSADIFCGRPTKLWPDRWKTAQRLLLLLYNKRYANLYFSTPYFINIIWISIFHLQLEKILCKLRII